MSSVCSVHVFIHISETSVTDKGVYFNLSEILLPLLPPLFSKTLHYLHPTVFCLQILQYAQLQAYQQFLLLRLKRTQIG